MSNHANPHVDRYFGNYRITAEIACGSFGSVYKARHSFLPRTAAIKLLHTVRINSPQDRERFFQEARLLTGLAHPHILPLYEAGIDGEFPYFISEYASGGSLRDLLQHRPSTPPSVEEAIAILSQVGEALSYAHQQNIIHRDIKPENILFNNNGDILLADFGIATVLNTAERTHTTAVHSTPVYMAPEQFQGIVSSTSDQYALGVIAYELLTGRIPFGTSPYDAWEERVSKHREETLPPLTRFNPMLPKAIEQAVLKALAKDRQERYVDLAAFLEALQSAMDRSHRENTSYPLAWYKKQLEEYEQVLRIESRSGREIALDKRDPFAIGVEHLIGPLVEKALTQLSWVERSCLLLSSDAQFASNEIAEIMGISEQEVRQALEQGRERLLRSYYLSLEQEQILPFNRLRAPMESDNARIAYLLKSIPTAESERPIPLSPTIQSRESAQLPQRNEEDNDLGSISGHKKRSLEFQVEVLCPDRFSELVFDEPESMVPIIKGCLERILREFLGRVDAEVILHPRNQKNKAAREAQNRDEDVPIPTPERPVRVRAIR